MEHLFFYLALAFILVHEMDAVRCREWRIFPGLSRLGDRTGYGVFTLLHLPLYALLFWGLWGRPDSGTLVRGLDLFFILHVGLHLLFLRHPENQFRDLFSWSLISGAGIFGLLDLLESFS